MCNATPSLIEGPVKDAERLVTEVLRLRQRAITWDAIALLRIHTFAIREGTGAARRDGSRDPHLGGGTPDPGALSLPACGHLLRARQEQARRAFEGLAVDAFTDLPPNNDWIHSVCPVG